MSLMTVAQTIETFDSFQWELLSDRFRECIGPALEMSRPSLQTQKTVKAEDLNAEQVDWIFVYLADEPGRLADELRALSRMENRSFSKTFTEKLLGSVNFDTRVEELSNGQIAGAFLATAKVYRS